MYNPNKGLVHKDRLFSIFGNLEMRFGSITDKALLKMLQKINDSKEHIDVESEFEEIMNELYREEIEKLIQDISDCVEK